MLRGASTARQSALALFVLALAALSCDDKPLLPTQPGVVPELSSAPPTASEIRQQIDALFPPPGLRKSARSQFDNIERQWNRGEVEDARAKVLELIDFTVTNWKEGRLLDPNGSAPPTTERAVITLIASLNRFVGLQAPEISEAAFSEDGAVEVVGTEGGTVATESGQSGIEFPPGALDSDVLVVITPIDDPEVPTTGPLPTSLPQYGPFHDLATYPEVPAFNEPVVVGMCQYESGPLAPPHEIHDRLRLAHPDPNDESKIQILERVTPSFLQCDGSGSTSLNRARGKSPWLAVERLVRRTMALFGPGQLYAAHGGLGGLSTSLSPFGAVDTGAEPMSFDAESYTVGVNQRLVQTLRLHNGTTDSVHVRLSHSDGSIYGTASTVAVPPGDDITFTGVGLAAGVDTVIATAPGYTSARAQVEVGYGTTALEGWPDTLVVGDSAALRLFTMDQAGNNRMVASSTVFRLEASSGIYLSDGPVRIDSAAVAEGDTVSRTFYVHADSATDAWLIVSNDAYVSDTHTVHILPPPAVELQFSTVDAGGRHTCGIATSGETYCWGDNGNAQLGTGSAESEPSPTPRLVATSLKFVSISVGGQHTCALTDEGLAYCWGYNGQGQLGSETASGTDPVLVRLPFDCPPNASCLPPPPLTFTSIAAGYHHTCGITPENVAYCWGRNDYGQLGQGTISHHNSTPTPVSGDLPFIAIDAGVIHTCGVAAVFGGGYVYCWGSNFYGMFGNGTSGTQSSTPVPGPGSGFTAISVGDYHTCGNTATDDVFCWGRNHYGQIGDGTTTDTNRPFNVPRKLAAIVLGAGHSCGVTRLGEAYCWGLGLYGELGNGATTNRSTLTRVAGDVSFTAVTAHHGLHTCGLASDNRAHCWGYNQFGQVGDGSLENRLEPVPVAPRPVF